VNPGKRKRILLNVALCAGSALFAIVLIELGVRVYLHLKLISAVRYEVMIYSEFPYDPCRAGLLKPRLEFWARKFDADHRLVLQARVKTNNYGLVSREDYALEKPKGEYRIAVLGDSLTHCITSDNPWTDVLQDSLNGDQELKEKTNVRSFKVMNFGLDGSGFPAMAGAYVRYAEPFCPDLVIINYIEDDFHREPGMAGAMAGLKNEHYAVPFYHPNAFDPNLMWRVGEVDVAINPFSGPWCFVARDDRVACDRKMISDVKKKVADRFARKRIWSIRESCAWKMIRSGSVRLSTPQTAPGLGMGDDQQVVDNVLSAVDVICSRNSRVLLLANPSYEDLMSSKPLKWTALLRNRARELHVVDMKPYLPRQTDDALKYSWYNLPADSHWSNEGVKVYGKAVHAAIRDNLSVLGHQGPGQNKRL
jgi:hypothetical protein